MPVMMEGNLAKGRFPMHTGKGKPQQMETPKGQKNGSTVRQGRQGRTDLSGRGRSSSAERSDKSGLKSRYCMLIQWSDEDQVYVVTLPEFNGPKTHGETYEEAVRMGEEVLELLIDSTLEDGDELPKPCTFDSNERTNQSVVRLLQQQGLKRRREKPLMVPTTPSRGDLRRGKGAKMTEVQ